MKKYRYLSIVFAVLVVLCGCQTEENIIEPDTPQIKESRLVEISSEELSEKEKDCNYFVLFVYKDGCPDCSAFSGILEKYLDVNKLKFYSIEENEFLKISSIANQHLEKTPFVAVYSKGEVLSYLDSNSEENKRFYGTVAGFTEWMKDKTEEYCLKPEANEGAYCSNSGC